MIELNLGSPRPKSNLGFSKRRSLIGPLAMPKPRMQQV